MEMNLKYLKNLFALCLILLSSTAFAQSTPWIENPNHPPVKLRFMLTGEFDPVTKTMPAVLEVKLEDDWKTYWRSPGEGGIAPGIKWDKSTNLKSVDWSWPVPEHFSLMGLQTWGYKHHVSFPLLLSVDDSDAVTNLRGKVTLSSCTTICVLTDYEVSLDVTPTKLRADSEAMFTYNKAVSKVPQKVENGVDSPIIIGWDSAKSKLMVELDAGQWRQPQLLIDGEPDTVFTLKSLKEKDSDSNSNKGPTKLIAIFDGSSWLGAPEVLGKTLNVTIVDSNQALEYSSEVIPTQVIEDDLSLLKVLFIALLGGLILNVMPCVLPVLGMKLSTVIAAPELKRNEIRQQFIASALGILVSFWLLAGFILMLKLTGQAIGWGVQFQNPWFIGFMAIVTSIFALNMLGTFEINLPSSLQTKLATTGGNNNRGHFLQGMFATLLATPCSAPFLGTAVAFALGADLLTLFVVFTALAVGMALPWLLVALFPQVANYFPKPGRWMNIVKVFFSVMLLITSLWLITLLSNFVNPGILWVFAGLLVLMFFVFMAKKHGAPAVVASVSLAILFSAVTAFMTSEQWARPLPTDLVWTPLNEAEIVQQVASGKTVFVDVTADWCITCKANKAGVILQDPVYSSLKQENMVIMKGDWTKPSAPITQYLQSHNRFGVPFNVVYGPNAPEGIALPEILSTAEVLSAIERASSGAIAANRAGGETPEQRSYD